MRSIEEIQTANAVAKNGDTFQRAQARLELQKKEAAAKDAAAKKGAK